MVKLTQILSATALGAALVDAAAVSVQTITVTNTKVKTVTETAFSVITKIKTVVDKEHTIVTKIITNTKKVPAATFTVTASASGCSSSSSVSTITSSSTINTYPSSTATATLGSSTMGLNDYARAAGKYLGTAVDIPGTGEAQDPIYMAVANNTHEFGSRTPANTMKFMFVEPQRGVFDFSGGDYFVNITKAAGINHIRCHALLWHQQLPTWLTSQTWDNATLISIIQNHITQTVAHFGDNCYSWDVVNEAIDDSANWRSTIFYNTIGPEFVPIAFQAASDAVKANNLSTKLYYNDYNNEGPRTAKTNATIALINSLKARDIQIDGVGLQSHFLINQTWGLASQQEAMATYATLGVEVAVTELDVRASTLPVSYELQVVQRNNYEATVGACTSTEACVGVTLWDFDDTYSWIPYTFAGQGWGCPWFRPENGTELVKKIAYDGIVDGFRNY